jgi:hypothetical protein
MKTLKVPKQNIADHKTIFDRIKYLYETGAEALIDNVNWKDDFPKRLHVTVHIAHDEDRLYLLYMVLGEVLRTFNNHDFDPVWEDSCVEFFTQRDNETNVYRNFECNANGVLLASLHQSREESAKFSPEEMASVFRNANITHHYEKNGKQVSDWSLYLEIPKKLLGFTSEESLSQKILRANFYKCGDYTAEPHFLSWNPILTARPNFHVPQFFGQLNLE